MSLLCQCPRSEALQDIPKADCPVNIGQIQKIVFSRLRDDAGALNSVSSLAASVGLPLWMARMTATDSTKIVVTPLINEPESEPGDAVMTSGGNADVGGIPSVLGSNATTFNCRLQKVPFEVGTAMKQFMCEELGVYLITMAGKILGLRSPSVTGDGERLRPIPIQAFFASDLGMGNFDTPSSYNISWSFPPNWSDDLVIVEPNFNPLTDLFVLSGVGLSSAVQAAKAKAAVDMVELISIDGEKADYEIKHAENILRMPNSGWKLPEDSKYTFSYENGIDKKSDTAGAQRAKAAEHDSKGDTAPK